MTTISKLDAIAKIISNESKLDVIDELGIIKAQIAELTAQEKVLTKRIKDNLGVGTFSGDLYNAAVTKVEDRSIPDPVAMEKRLRDLGVDNRWFSKNQKTVSGYTSVRISARKTA